MSYSEIVLVVIEDTLISTFPRFFFFFFFFKEKDKIRGTTVTTGTNLDFIFGIRAQTVRSLH